MPLPHFTGANALLACTAFVIGVASPGPSVLAVLGTAMAQGRARAGAGGRRRRRFIVLGVVRGVAMHLTNPKAIVVWLSVVSLALPTGARQAR